MTRKPHENQKANLPQIKFNIAIISIIAIIIITYAILYSFQEEKITTENKVYNTKYITKNDNPQNLSITELSEKARKLANEDINKAKEFCSKIYVTNKKDFCFKEIAHESLNPNLCAHIEVISTADFCYIKFMNNGNQTICEKIKTNSLRAACQTAST